MSDFNETSLIALNNSNALSTHGVERDILKRYSVQRTQKDSESKLSIRNAELASLGILLKSSNDEARPVQNKISLYSRGDPTFQDPAHRTLGRDSLKVAGITLNRDDIAEDDRGAKNYGYLLKRVDGYHCVNIINNNAIAEHKHNTSAFRKKRLDLIAEAVEQESNIIVLGEFDYPPEEESGGIDAYDSQIKEIIDAKTHPIFLIAGSRHTKVQLPVPGGLTKWVNEAKIFANKVLYNNAGSVRSPYWVYHKRVAAVKAGERISTPDTIEFQYFDTEFGRIAILICVDAYDPTMVFTLIHTRLQKENKIDYVLIPSYNVSFKFSYACQALSLLCKCVVILVDTCTRCNLAAHGKPQKAIYINGVEFDDHDVGVGTKEILNDHISIWEVNDQYRLEESCESSKEQIDLRKLDTSMFDQISKLFY